MVHWSHKMELHSVSSAFDYPMWFRISHHNSKHWRFCRIVLVVQLQVDERVESFALENSILLNHSPYDRVIVVKPGLVTRCTAVANDFNMLNYLIKFNNWFILLFFNSRMGHQYVTSAHWQQSWVTHTLYRMVHIDESGGVDVANIRNCLNYAQSAVKLLYALFASVWTDFFPSLLHSFRRRAIFVGTRNEIK